MSNEEDQIFIPHRRTFHIEKISRLKLSLVDEKSQLEINRVFESNGTPEKTIERHPSIDKQFLAQQNPVKCSG